jgi:hypothetical protein
VGSNIIVGRATHARTIVIQITSFEATSKSFLGACETLGKIFRTRIYFHSPCSCAECHLKLRVGCAHYFQRGSRVLAGAPRCVPCAKARRGGAGDARFGGARQTAARRRPPEGPTCVVRAASLKGPALAPRALSPRAGHCRDQRFFLSHLCFVACVCVMRDRMCGASGVSRRRDCSDRTAR